MLPAHPRTGPNGSGMGQPWEQLSLATVSLHPGLSVSSHPCGFPPSASAQQLAGNAQEKRPRASPGLPCWRRASCAVPRDPPLGCSTPGLPILAQTTPPSLSLFDAGHPARAFGEQALWVMPHRLSPLPANSYSRGHPRSSSLPHRSPTAGRTREQFLEPLRHTPLGGICREAEELNEVIHSFTYRPPPSSSPPERPHTWPAR